MLSRNSVATLALTFTSATVKKRSITQAKAFPNLYYSIEHTQLLIPQLARVNIDIPLHGCDQLPRKGHSTIEDRDYARPIGRLIKFQPAQVCLVKIDGAYAESWWYSKLCGLRATMRKRSIVDREGEIFVKSFKFEREKERLIHVKERLDGEVEDK